MKSKAALFSFPPFYIVSAFYLAMFPITYYYLRKINKLDFFPYAALIFMININAIYYALGINSKTDSPGYWI